MRSEWVGADRFRGQPVRYLWAFALHRSSLMADYHFAEHVRIASRYDQDTKE
jgi:hypothetical protein